MSFHIFGLYKNVAAGAAFVELLPITDALMPINSATNRFYSSKDMMLFSAWAGATNLSRARVYTPWKLPNEIRPVGASVTPKPFVDSAQWLDVPMSIPATHDIIVDAVHTNGVAQDVFGVLMGTTPGGLTSIPRDGEVVTIRGDISGAAPTARQWSEVTVAWEYSLAPGDYAVVGSECFSTNAVAHRWIFEHSTYRPGALATSLSSTLPALYQMYGATGDWGHFTVPLMPRLEVLCSAVDATMTVFLQIIPL